MQTLDDIYKETQRDLKMLKDRDNKQKEINKMLDEIKYLKEKDTNWFKIKKFLKNVVFKK